MSELLPEDDEPKTWRELAEAAIADLRRYAHDEGPERRMVSVEAYEERMTLLAEIDTRAAPAAEGDVEKIRAEVMLECAKSICVLCNEGRPLNEHGDHVSRPGAGGILLPDGRCHAWGIHRALAARQAGGG